MRLPGAVAYWDERQVTRAVGDADIRILVAPPGLSEDQQDQVRDVENATIRIMGTEIVGSVYQVGQRRPRRLARPVRRRRRHQPAAGDHLEREERAAARRTTTCSPCAHRPPPSWPRWPLTCVPAARTSRAGATLSRQADERGRPRSATRHRSSWPRSASSRTPSRCPNYGPALAKLFPDTPIVVLYGNWISYYGPHAGEFADVAAAGFYARYGELLSRYDFPQDNVLDAYFDHVTTSATPGCSTARCPTSRSTRCGWRCPRCRGCSCVRAGFLALSVRSVLRPAAPARRASRPAWSRSDHARRRAVGPVPRPGTHPRYREARGRPCGGHRGPAGPPRAAAAGRRGAGAGHRGPQAGPRLTTVQPPTWGGCRMRSGSWRTPFGLAVVGLLVLAGWALWSAGIFDDAMQRQIRTSSVYTAPGVDLDRAEAEQIIGNRRLVVGVPRGRCRPRRSLRRHRNGRGRHVRAAAEPATGDELDHYGCSQLRPATRRRRELRQGVRGGDDDRRRGRPSSSTSRSTR